MISQILRRINKANTLNILTFTTHERHSPNLCLTGHNFYSYQGHPFRTWNTKVSKIPPNYYILPVESYNHNNELTIPNIQIDLILSQNKAGQIQTSKKLQEQLRVPLISLEHTLPTPGMTREQILQMKQLSGDVNVFITDFNREAWCYSKEESEVIYHGINTDIFQNYGRERQNRIISVVNDWKNRDIFCGFNLWQQITQGLPTFPVGETPGVSTGANSLEELVGFLNDSRIFLNTSIASPIPMSVLEGMACGCAVVSTATCLLPDIIKNGENGFISNDPYQLRYYLEVLLQNKDMARRMGEKARETIKEKFNLQTFIDKWNDLFYRALK